MPPPRCPTPLHSLSFHHHLIPLSRVLVFLCARLAVSAYTLSLFWGSSFAFLSGCHAALYACLGEAWQKNSQCIVRERAAHVRARTHIHIHTPFFSRSHALSFFLFSVERRGNHRRRHHTLRAQRVYHHRAQADTHTHTADSLSGARGARARPALGPLFVFFGRRRRRRVDADTRRCGLFFTHTHTRAARR